MDVIIFALLFLASLILTLFSFLGNKAGWGFLALLGATVMMVTALALFTDGNLTSGTTTLAAANGNFDSDFNAIEVMQTALAIGVAVVGIRKIFRI